MPISDLYEAIFIHIPKTAGSSIEDMLGIQSESEFPLTENTQLPLECETTLLNRMDPVHAPQHDVPWDVWRKIDPWKWDTYYKFTIVRDPYQRAISSYHFLKDAVNYELNNMSDFLQQAYQAQREHSYDSQPFHHHFRPQWDYFDSYIVYDYVGHFETLAQDMQIIKHELGCTTPLPFVNHRPYNRTYDWDRNELLLFDKVYGADRVFAV